MTELNELCSAIIRKEISRNAKECYFAQDAFRRRRKRGPIILRYNRFNKNFSEDELDQALKYAKATLVIEGQYIPNGAEEIIRWRLKNEISQAEFRKAALEMATRR